jgi:hypothetical protein
MKWRTECHKRFGPVQDFPLRSVNDELGKLLRSGSSVLDVGAGAHKPFRSFFLRATDRYYTLDTDPEGDFDFRSFEDVSQTVRFDLILANQVLEHLAVDDAFSLVRSAFDRLNPSGRLVATVPNTAHPVRQRDCTHITAWPANDLYSLLRSAGFQVESMARYNKTPLTSNPIRRWLVGVVCREFRVDWCDSIMAVGLRES